MSASPSVMAVLLADLSARGITLAADGERLLCRPRSAMTPDLVARVKENKDAVLAAIRPAEQPANPNHGHDARLLEDIVLWPQKARDLYRQRLREAVARREPVHLRSLAESAAREEAEIAAGWHSGWPGRSNKRGGDA